MFVAIVIVMIASFISGMTNHIDKFLIGDIDSSGSNIKTLLVFSTLVAGIVISPIYLIISKFSVYISALSLGIVAASAVVYITATYLYFKALESNDASIIVVMYQSIPVFSYCLALILFKEQLTVNQIIGSLIILFSAVIISFDFEHKSSGKKIKALFLITISAILCSIYYILFDIAIRDSSYNSCIFWFQISLLAIGLILVCIKSNRTMFVQALKNNGMKYFGLNALNEMLNLISLILLNYANVLIPIAIVNVLNGFQGAFVFVIGAIGVKLLPKYFNENLDRKVVVQKISCIAISILGLIIM